MQMTKKERADRKIARSMSKYEADTLRIYILLTVSMLRAEYGDGRGIERLNIFSPHLEHARYWVGLYDSVNAPTWIPDPRPISEQLTEARARLDSIMDSFDRYSGGNPNKYQKEIQRCSAAVEYLEKLI